MNISGTVRQIKNQAGKSSTIPGARVTVIVGERELGGMKTDLLGRYGYEEVSDYPGATLVCKVEAKGFHSKTEKVVLEQSTIQLDIELEPIPPEQTWIQWICERLRWMTEWPPIWWAIGGMVAVLFVILLVVDQCTPDNNHPPTPAAMVWKPVGQEAFTEGNARQVTMMVEKNVPYVAYQDVERGKKGTVMKYASEKWSPVGNPGFSAGELTELSLAVEGEQPWVAYRDSVKRFQLTVKKFSGERWESVGEGPLSNERISQFVSLGLYRGVPYVGYWELGIPNRAFVQRWNGNSWEVLGNKPVVESLISDFKMAVDESEVYVAYATRKEPNPQFTVRRFEDSQWEPLSDKVPSELPYKLAKHTFAFTVHKKHNYLAFSNQEYQGKLTVLKINERGSFVLGSPEVSKGTVEYPSLAIAGDTVYVAFKDKGRGGKSVVLKLGSKDKHWEMVDREFSGPDSSGLALAVDKQGIPYVAFQEGKDKGWKLTVMRLEPQ